MIQWISAQKKKKKKCYSEVEWKSIGPFGKKLELEVSPIDRSMTQWW